jgi:glycosyltransferase involved in cell wall biosynthesis
MRNICFFNTNKEWGGAEKWHLTVALHCRDNGDRVLAVTNKGSALFGKLHGEDGLSLHQITVTNISFLNPFKLWAAYRLFRIHRVDTVIINLPSDLKLAGMAAKLAGVQKIIYRRGSAEPVKDRWLNRFLFRHVITRVIANSEEIRRTILQENPLLLPEERITVVYNAMDVETFDRQTVMNIPHNEDKCIIGNAGRFVDQKGQEHLIGLAQRLKTQGERFRLLIAGEGKKEAELRKAAAAADVTDVVEFLGFVDRMPQFFAEIDIFVFPSQHEGSSNTVLEAMAARKPVIAFRVSSLPEMVISGETGLLVEPGNIDALTQAVTALMHDNHIRHIYGEKGRKRVEETFSMQRMLREFRAIIDHP